MQDRCFNIGSALTYNNYRSVQPPFNSPFLSSLRLSRLPSAAVFRVFFRGRLVGVSEESSRPLPHIDESGSLADQKLILFVQFNIDRTLQLGKAGATPRGCAEIKTKRRGFGEKLSVGYLLLRVL